MPRQSLELGSEVVRPLRFGFLWSPTWVQRWYSLTHQGVLLCSAAPKAAPQSQAGTVADAYLVRGQYVRPLGYGLPVCQMFPIQLHFRAHSDSQRGPLQARPEWYSSSSSGVDGSSPLGAENSVVLFAEDACSAQRWVRAVGDAARSGPLRLSARYRCDRGNVLGSGLFATVFQATEIESGKTCALKMIKPDMYREFQAMMHREVAIWSAVNGHPHVCELLDVWSSDTRLYLVSELCQGGGLLDFLSASRSHCEADAARIMRQVLEALAHIHSRGVVHCDMKPENICLATKAPDSPIKVLDFSLASFTNCPMEPGGTPEFVAPELLLAPEHHAVSGCTAAVDMWSAGVLLYFLLSGETPFFEASKDAVIARVKAGVWSFRGPAWVDVSDHAKSLVSKLLQPCPEARPSAREALNHPWFGAVASAPGAYTRVLAAACAAFKVPPAVPSSLPKPRGSGGWIQAAAKLLSLPLTSLALERQASLIPSSLSVSGVPEVSSRLSVAVSPRSTHHPPPRAVQSAPAQFPVPFSEQSHLAACLAESGTAARASLRHHVSFRVAPPSLPESTARSSSNPRSSDRHIALKSMDFSPQASAMLSAYAMLSASVGEIDTAPRQPCARRTSFCSGDPNAAAIQYQEPGETGGLEQRSSQVDVLLIEVMALRARVEAGKAQAAAQAIHRLPQQQYHLAPAGAGPPLPAPPDHAVTKSSSVTNLRDLAADATPAPPPAHAPQRLQMVGGHLGHQQGAGERTGVRRSSSLTAVMRSARQPGSQVLLLQQQLLELHAKRLAVQQGCPEPAAQLHALQPGMSFISSRSNSLLLGPQGAPMLPGSYQPPAAACQLPTSSFQLPAAAPGSFLPASFQPPAAASAAAAAPAAAAAARQLLEEQASRLRQIQLLQQEVEMLKRGRGRTGQSQARWA